MKGWRLYPRTRARRYDQPAKLRWLRHGVMVVLAAVLVFSAFKVGGYVGDHLASRQGSQQLRESYHQPQATAAPSAAPAATATPAAAAPTSLPGSSAMLPSMKYPDNPYAIISSRFRKLQRQNGDIVAWLTIQNVIDEAVVQRDNTYYLTRDYRGFHNVNGAIFMDEGVKLHTRPYTVTLYGHNMKTGAMFGVLRNYENRTFYQHNPFVTFDTAYEDGRYVIFSVATVHTSQFNKDFLDFGKLNASTIAWRQEAIDQLESMSMYTSTIDVQPQDQLLLLVTCVEDDEERRIVAARRLRDGEMEEALLERVESSRKKTY